MFELLTPGSVDRAQWKQRLHGPPPGLSNLYFTRAWPNAGDTAWASGKYFQITDTAVVPYDKGYVIPGNDTLNVNLSNVVSSPVSLFPGNTGVVYEILIGLKPGSYQMGLYVPGVQDYLLALGYSDMYPQPGDANKRFLGVFAPGDSPADDPMIKIWAIFNQAPWILKYQTNAAVDFEKIVTRFKIGKHVVRDISATPPSVYTTIRYYQENKGTW